MLTQHELTELERSLRNSLVLSVYLDGRVRDPAERTVWRTQLDHELERAREMVAERGERKAFDVAAGQLREELAPFTGTISAPGWMGFVATDGERRSTTIPVPPPFYVRWGNGAAVAPALRALKETRPAIVAIVDSRSARLYRYAEGTVQHLETLRAHTPIDPVYHMSAPPSPGFHPGTHGEPGKDAAERELRAGRAHMMKELASRVVEEAGTEGWILLGGVPVAAHEASANIPDSAASRTMLLPELQLRSSESSIAQYAAQGASTLRRREDLASVHEVIERAGAGGRAAMRLPPVKSALGAGAVQRLLITERYTEGQPEQAEALVRAAFDEGADVEVVSGDGATLLDTQADGVGALLRFVPPMPS